jgi:hypothetical protein
MHRIPFAVSRRSEARRTAWADDDTDSVVRSARIRVDSHCGGQCIGRRWDGVVRRGNGVGTRSGGRMIVRIVRIGRSGERSGE